jgi:hypothetical protein
MEAVIFKSANIQQATPAKRSSRAGHDACDFATLGLHSSQHGFNGGRYRNAKRFACATLGAGESKDAILQIDALKRDLCFTKSASSSQGDLEADSHPFGHTFHSQSLLGDFNFIVRKDRFNAGYRPPFNSVIQKGNGVHFSKQSTLPVNPFDNLQILARLVPSGLAAGGAGEALAPSQINFTIIRRKRLQTYSFFINKPSKMTPRISVINFCKRANGVIFNQVINPFVAAIFSLFVNAKSSCVSRCLCTMQSIVDSVAGAFATPLACWIFEPNKEPRTPLFNVGISQGDNGNIRLVERKFIQ